MLDVCLMGTGGSMPKPDRWLSSLLMRYEGKSLVIDCGEGTQLALKESGFNFKPVGLLLITHFHADHVSGLPGFLLSMGNEGRTEPLMIAGPRGISHIVRSLCVVAPGLPFEVHIAELPHTGGSFVWEDFEITAFEADHRCPCLGYKVHLPRKGKFDVEKAKARGVPLKAWKRLQDGEKVEIDGVTFTPGDVLGPPRRGLTVCYATDTRPKDTITEAARGADLLVLEGMFGSDKQERAREAMHMTMTEAARIAAEAEPRALWLTHFSPSVPDPSVYVDEAREIFPGAVAGIDGMTAALSFD